MNSETSAFTYYIFYCIQYEHYFIPDFTILVVGISEILRNKGTKLRISAVIANKKDIHGYWFLIIVNPTYLLLTIDGIKLGAFIFDTW